MNRILYLFIFSLISITLFSNCVKATSGTSNSSFSSLNTMHFTNDSMIKSNTPSSSPNIIEELQTEETKINFILGKGTIGKSAYNDINIILKDLDDEQKLLFLTTLASSASIEKKRGKNPRVLDKKSYFFDDTDEYLSVSPSTYLQSKFISLKLPVPNFLFMNESGKGVLSECPDPKKYQLITSDSESSPTTIMGYICGKDNLVKYRLSLGLSHFCVNTINSKFYSEHCETHFSLSSMIDFGGALCKHDSEVNSFSSLSIFPIPNKNDTYAYIFKIGGQESCKLHSVHHEIADSIINIYNNPLYYSFKGRAKNFITDISDATWNSIADNNVDLSTCTDSTLCCLPGRGDY